MTEVGQRLRIERERRRLPRADVARATGVYIHHLTALEHGDHGDLPEDEIVAGYVRACAEHLELDSAELVADFCRERGISEPSPPEELPAADIASVETEPAAMPAVTSEEPLPEEPATNDDEVTVQAEEAPIEEPAPDEPTPAPAPSTSPARGIPLPLLIAAGLLLLLLLIWWISGDDAPVTEPNPTGASSEERAAATPAPVDLPDDAPPIAVEPKVEQVQEVAENDSTPPAATRPLTVSEHGVGTGVEDHRLVGESDSFAAGTKVWFWTRVRGGVAGQAIRHVWLHDGEVVEGITLRLGSSNWRTQSAKTLYSTGRWAVEARDADGAVLARTEFTSRPAR